MIWDNELQDWVYNFNDPEDIEKWSLEWIGSREYIIDQFRKARGCEQCTDEEFAYYATVVNGHRLMYRKAKSRPDGRKMFRLTDELAMLLQLENLKTMKHILKSIQYWRGWVSPERLTIAMKRYTDEQKKVCN